MPNHQLQLTYPTEHDVRIRIKVIKMSIKTVLVILLFVGIISLVVYGFYKQVLIRSEIFPVIMKDLINPYIGLIAGERYEDAYSKYTSKNFKTKYSLKEYIEAQKKNREKYGILQKTESNIGTFDEVTEIGTRTFYNGILKYTGSKDFTYIAVDIIREEETYKFDRIYEHSVVMNMNSEKIF